MNKVPTKAEPQLMSLSGTGITCPADAFAAFKKRTPQIRARPFMVARRKAWERVLLLAIAARVLRLALSKSH